ncbi:guanine deaminase [Mycotypha africana]|uniref:guanine deaminase n=1 Tax=Mycotypha africana TaxID=64632 RepID=UPI002300E87C|nr:guanine deaminase [Mycotypha africana]KAI8984027.1 guanine deaminase [Mycotypha africana]
MTKYTVYHGTFVHSASIKELDIVSNGIIVVDNETGLIAHVERDVKDLETFLNSSSFEDATVQKVEKEQFLIPGFVDTHAHAPQYMFAGSGMDLQLLEWLETYVFPCESSFKDADHAKQAYEKVIRRFLRNGTTTCSWFATIHLNACQVLVDIIEQLGQRAYVGKVNMDQNSPDFYIEETDSSLNDTRAFIQYVQGKKNELLTPVVTPRFAITCSSKLMHGLSALAKEYQVPIQTHLCENHNEIEFTCSLFKESKDYTSIYDDHGLLTEKAYMAHCVHMKDEEIDMLAARRTGVSHCANSNFSLHSGVCDVRRFLEKNVKVGLGTDVAGGFSPSMLDAIRSTFFASKTQKIIHRDMLEKGEDSYTPLSPAELLYLATVGGAQVLGLEEKIGSFEKGKAFDALWVDLLGGSIDLMGGENELQKVEKFLFNGSDQNLKHVYVQGRRVSSRD